MKAKLHLYAKYLGLVVLAVGGVLVMFFMLAYGSLVVRPIPDDAVIKVNGRIIQPNKSIRLANGQKTIEVTSRGYETQHLRVSISPFRIRSIRVSLQPQYSKDPANPGSQKADELAAQYEKANPIIKLLPYNGPDFIVGYGTSSQSDINNPYRLAIVVTAGSNEAKQSALKWISSQGFDLAKMEIRYQAPSAF